MLVTTALCGREVQGSVSAGAGAALHQQPTLGRLDEFEQSQARGEGDHGSEVPCGILASEGDALEALHAARDMTQRYGFAKQA